MKLKIQIGDKVMLKRSYRLKLQDPLDKTCGDAYYIAYTLRDSISIGEKIRERIVEFPIPKVAFRYQKVSPLDFDIGGTVVSYLFQKASDKNFTFDRIEDYEVNNVNYLAKIVDDSGALYVYVPIVLLKHI